MKYKMHVFYFRNKFKACAFLCLIFIVINSLDIKHSSNKKNGGFDDKDIAMKNQTMRFWELLNMTNSSEPLTRLPNLWSPITNETLPLLSRADDRVLAQLIWIMEMGTETNDLSLTGSLKMKIIYLPESFDAWYKPNWQSPHILEAEDCPGNSSIVGKCAFSDSESPEPEGMDAILTQHYRDNLPANVSQFIYKLESPYHTKATLRRNNDLLVSYYRGSDVSTPYGKWVYFNPAVRFRDQEKDYAKGKTKMAAILVSNCKRLEYVEELQKYIEVDVYGRCGKSCGSQCFEILKTDYRFYLSFENSNCRDYITEKLFKNAYGNDVIPIVFGAHPDDYRALCPEKSYIHVEDFAGPKELADHMKHLAVSPSDYNMYFQWKGTGKFVGTYTFCQVCAMAHYADLVSPPERTSDFVWEFGTLTLQMDFACLLVYGTGAGIKE